MQAVAAGGEAVSRSQALDESLARAHKLAVAQGHASVALEHLLFALSEDADALAMLEASAVDIERLRTDVSVHIGRLGETGAATPGTPPSPGADLLRILQLAGMAARQSQRRQIDGGIVIAATVGDGNSAAAGLLKSHGLTFDSAIRALQQGPRQQEIAREPARPGLPAPADAEPAPPPRVEPATPPPAAEVKPAPKEAEAKPPPVAEKPTTTDDMLAAVRARVKKAEPAIIPPRPAVVRTPDPPPPVQTMAAPEQPPPLTRPDPPPVVPLRPVTADRPPAERPTQRPQQPAGPSAPSTPPPLAQLRRPTTAPPPLPVSPPQQHMPPAPGPYAQQRPPMPPARQPAPYQVPPQHAPRPQGPPPMMAPMDPHRPPPQPTAYLPHAARSPAPMPSSLLPAEPLDIVAAASGLPATVRNAAPVLVEIRIPRSQIDVPWPALRAAMPGSEGSILRAVTVRLTSAPSSGVSIEPRTPETTWLAAADAEQGPRHLIWQYVLVPSRTGVFAVTLAVNGRTISTAGMSSDVATTAETFAVKVKGARGALLKRSLGPLLLLGIGGGVGWALGGPLSGVVKAIAGLWR